MCWVYLVEVVRRNCKFQCVPTTSVTNGYIWGTLSLALYGCIVNAAIRREKT